MFSMPEIRLNCNRDWKINFDGGDLSSDAGLLLFKEFIHRFGVQTMLANCFKTTDTASYRVHRDDANLLQMILQIVSGYFTDDCADELAHEPVMTAILGKERLASQPTLSRFFQRMDDTTLNQFAEIARILRRRIYSVEKPEQILLDLDSTLCPTYGKQEGSAFNYHYQAEGYHPLLCFDGLTGDLLKAELRNGSMYCSKGAADFLKPLLVEYQEYYPEIPLYLRGDSGFATGELYDLCEEQDVHYAIRLKQNPVLMSMAKELDDLLMQKIGTNLMDYAVVYGEFTYRAKTWAHERRVVCKIEKHDSQMIPMHTFIVTNMALPMQSVVDFYCNRGIMENFIKECKSGFDMAAVSSHTEKVNANRVQLHALAYNLFNWFRRLALPVKMRKLRIDAIRIKLLKIAAKVTHSGRYLHFKLCSSCAYKAEYWETAQNIAKLRPLLT